MSLSVYSVKDTGGKDADFYFVQETPHVQQMNLSGKVNGAARFGFPTAVMDQQVSLFLF